MPPAATLQILHAPAPDVAKVHAPAPHGRAGELGESETFPPPSTQPRFLSLLSALSVTRITLRARKKKHVIGNPDPYMEDSITVRLKDGGQKVVPYRHSWDAFYHPNPSCMYAVFAFISEITDRIKLGLDRRLDMVEVYSGAGVNSLYLVERDRCSYNSARCVEYDKRLCDSCEGNVQRLGIANIFSTIHSEADHWAAKVLKNVVNNSDNESTKGAEVLTQSSAHQHVFDVLIVDPPRSGLTPKMITLLKTLSFPHLIYISCDPSAMKRDMDLIKDSFNVEDVGVFDLFPGTFCVESVGYFTRREG